MLALLGDRALHQQYQNNKRRRQDGAHPEDIEEGERRGLLLAEVVERLDRQLLRAGRVAGPLLEELAGLLQKRLDMGVQRAQVLAEAGEVELLARVLDGLGSARCRRCPPRYEAG